MTTSARLLSSRDLIFSIRCDEPDAMNHMTTGVIESDGEDEELFMRYVLGTSPRVLLASSL